MSVTGIIIAAAVSYTHLISLSMKALEPETVEAEEGTAE